MTYNDNPKLIEGNFFLDDRGTILSNNSLMLENYKRFYVVGNHNINFVRAWHGHKEERKVFICLTGSFKIGLVKIDNFDNPDPNLMIQTFYLVANSGTALEVPPGYANGLMNLQENSHLMVISDKDLKSSQADDYRFPWDFWNTWDIKQR